MYIYSKSIEEIWEKRDSFAKDSADEKLAKQSVYEVIAMLEKAEVRVCERVNDIWTVNEWVKKAVLLYFKFTNMSLIKGGDISWYDKVLPRFSQSTTADEFNQIGTRTVPGSYIRKGAYIGDRTVIMPSFINIGAYVGSGTLVDTWATIGSCAQIGSNCHISGGTGIGGVLEPLQARPVIIEDNCFIGARSEIAEGVIVEEGAVISMGVFIGSSTKIINRDTGEIIYGRVPAYSVVVPGNIQGNSGISTYCAVIVKKVDEKTRSKTSITELLRENG